MMTEQLVVKIIKLKMKCNYNIMLDRGIRIKAKILI